MTVSEFLNGLRMVEDKYSRRVRQLEPISDIEMFALRSLIDQDRDGTVCLGELLKLLRTDGWWAETQAQSYDVGRMSGCERSGALAEQA